MKVTLKNIAKIKEAEIELNGITVIAGENSTGKSTVGKVLYSFYASFFQLEDKIRQDLEKSLSNMLRFHTEYREAGELSAVNILAKQLVAEYYNKGLNTEEIKILLQGEKNISFLSDEQLEFCADFMSKTLSLPKEDMAKIIVLKYLTAEFETQIVHVNHNEGRIVFEIKGKRTEILLEDQVVKSINTQMQITSDVVYIDSPLIIDRNGLPISFSLMGDEHHRRDTSRKFQTVSKYNNLATETLTANRIKKLEKFWNNTIPGEREETDLGEAIRMGGLKQGISVPNLSTGMKTFLILKTILQNGHIRDRGVVILDEPEIHLHPEWQIYLAELIVLLQKEFDLTILLSTHSPYFLNAVEVYSAKYQMADKCKYYLAETEGVYAKIKDVTKQTDLIYQKLAGPLQQLDKLTYEME